MFRRSNEIITFFEYKMECKVHWKSKSFFYSPLSIFFPRLPRFFFFFKMVRFNDSQNEKYTSTLTDLEKIVLRWDYHVKSKFPKKKSLFSRDRYNFETIDSTALPDVFRSYTQYFSAFKPMVILECWEQMQKAKWEKNKPHIAEFSRFNKVKSDDICTCVSELTIKASNVMDTGLYEGDLIVISYFRGTTIDDIPQAPSSKVPYELGIIKKMKCASGECSITVASSNIYFPDIPSECVVHVTKVMR